MNGTISRFSLAAGVAAALAWSAVAAGRTVTPLMEGWTCDGEAVTLPHTWNAQDGADGAPEEARAANLKLKNQGGFTGLLAKWNANSARTSFAYRRTAAVYEHALPDLKPGRRLFFRCGAASVTANVYVNGTLVGRHLGAYTAFCYELTPDLAPSNNVLAVLVDNSWNPDVPTLSADFTIFGGLYRDAALIETDAVCIDPTVHGGPGLAVRTDPDTGDVEVRVALSGGDAAATFAVDGVRCDGPKFRMADFERWSPEHPKVYRLTVTLANGDAVTIPFGFRKAGFDADGMFRLNGEVRKLRGVNRHQDRDGKGWAISAADEAEDVALIAEMGADAVRTAHYPASPCFYDLTDATGLVVWCELPLTDTLSDSPACRAVLAETVREMVAQYAFHPSICMWSVFNEVGNPWSERLTDRKLVAGLDACNALFKQLDPTLPTVAASCKPKFLAANAVPDAIGSNTYPGWYDGRADKMAKSIDRFADINGRKAIGISEYGAGASVAQHRLPSKKVEPGSRWHPEEYQAEVHLGQYRAIRASGRVWGSFVWNMFDFAADMRDEGDHAGRNDKGLVTYDRRTRKDAFYLYQANWTKAPVLHLVGSRLTKIESAAAPVTVFSNCGPVTLRLNGAVIGTKTPDEVCSAVWTDLPFKSGENRLELTAGTERVAAVWTL